MLKNISVTDIRSFNSMTINKFFQNGTKRTKQASEKPGHLRAVGRLASLASIYFFRQAKEVRNAAPLSLCLHSTFAP